MSEPRSNPQAWARLSPRERDIIKLLGRGLNAPDIAEQLDIKVSTVRGNIMSMLKKLDQHSQHGLVGLFSDLAA